MYPEILKKLIEIFSRFPGVGQRTATRFTFYLLKKKKEEIEEIAKRILDLNKIKFCHFCFNPFLPTEKENLCSICQDPKRDRQTLLVLEKEVDLESIEKTKKYFGLYFILGGLLSSLNKEDIEKLKIYELKSRIENPKKFGLNTKFKEIILGFNLTTEGETTALYLEKILKDAKIKISRLARGLPTGGEIEYADEQTIASALEGRK